MNRIFDTFLISVLMFFLPFCAFSAPSFRHIGAEEGFGQTNVTSMYQDILGTLWTAGINGVVRYSGVQPEDHAPISDNQIFRPFQVKSVFGEGDRYVYFCQTDNVIRYDIENGECIQVFDSLSLSGQNLTVACVSKGNVCAASSRSIIVSSDNGVISYVLPDNIGEVTSIIRTDDGTIYFGTLRSGVFRIGDSGKIVSLLDIDTKVNALYEDSRGIIWVCTRSEGLLSISSDGKIRQYLSQSADGYSLTDNFTRCICEDNNGHMWIGMMFGLDCLDVSTGEIQHFGKSDDSYFGMRNLTIECLLCDKSGKIWCGSYYTGLSYFRPEDTRYKVFPVRKSGDVSASIIVDIVSDRYGNIWAGTSDKGLYNYMPSSQRGRFFQKCNSDIPGNNVKCLLYDDITNRLWIGMFMGGVAVMDIDTGRIRKISLPLGRYNTEDAEIVHSICLHSDDIYAATYAGVYRIDRYSCEAELVIDLHKVFNVLVSDSLIYVVTEQNIFHVYGKDADSGYSVRKVHSFNDNKVTVMRPDFQNHVWFGTTHGGAVMYNPDSEEFNYFTEENCGIAGNMVSSLSALPGGMMLLGTSSGLTLLDPENKKCENFNRTRGFPIGSLENGCIWRSDEGTVYCGGSNAFAVFADSTITRPSYSPEAFFLSLSVNDRTVYVGDASGILQKSLPYSDRITIGHKSRILDFHIGTDNSSEFVFDDFQYMLIGYDDEWKKLNGTSVRYMNLPAGEYVLTLRTRPDKLFEGPQSVSLGIKVFPPLYASVFAYVFYIILLIGSTAFVLNYFYSKKQLVQTIEFERMDKKRQEKVNQWKLVFFTNISHEFRTPLTLIIGQLDIIAKYELPEPVNGFFQSVRRNANRLQSLVNELIDFRKQEQGHMSLKMGDYDIVGYLRSVCEDFYEYGQIRNIAFDFMSDSESHFCHFDQVQLQKVFYNLISNAFKHTGNGGKIQVRLNCGTDMIRVDVSDTGHGIDRSKFGYIFERFYHEGIDATDTGVGIGLALSKGIVELHGGTISVDSQVGVGSVFTVEIPVGNVQKTNEPKEITVKQNEPAMTCHAEGAANYRNSSDTGTLPLLLIVEDDKELQLMLQYALSSDFEVILASDGKAGLELARSRQPALIVSDVMMPEVSGKEMCRILKSEFETCHIPVILLTALSYSEHVLEGLECGADDYITKPFEISLLQARCLAAVRNRKLLYDKYLNANKFPDAKDTYSNEETGLNLDERFAASVMSLIDSHIEDSQLGVNLMCKELGLSRTLLFLKIKGVFGKTPTELIQQVRMSKAAKMLVDNPEMKISEITDSVGINSIQYFGKLFKIYYGVTPTEYRSKK